MYGRFGSAFTIGRSDIATTTKYCGFGSVLIRNMTASSNNMSSSLTPELILERLRGVKYPGYSRDIVSFGPGQGRDH